MTSTTPIAQGSTNYNLILFLAFDFEHLTGVAMSDQDLGLFEFELGLLQLSLYQHASVHMNAR